MSLEVSELITFTATSKDLFLCLPYNTWPKLPEPIGFSLLHIYSPYSWVVFSVLLELVSSAVCCSAIGLYFISELFILFMLLFIKFGFIILLYDGLLLKFLV